jgi:Ca2+-transporting ATPase
LTDKKLQSTGTSPLLPPCLQSHDEILGLFGTSTEGISSSDVETAQGHFGYNELPEGKRRSVVATFTGQFHNPLIYALLLAVAALFFQREPVDGAIVLAVLLCNAAIGTYQEGRAQQALAALKRLSNSTATVLRDGEHRLIPDREVVPGDIVILNEGESIPADARILHSHELQVSEAVLTGESAPVHKNGEKLEGAEIVKGDNGLDTVPIHLQRNMVFKGTHVSSGSATAVVVAIGRDTAIGAISEEIASIDQDLPLKKNVEVLSRQVITAVVGIGLSLMLYGLYRGEDLSVLFATSVSLAVSLIPEGLPIVLTYVLASGVWHMSKRNVLVKKLQAVEALGQANVIAVDKTGTITRNELAVTKAWSHDIAYDVEASGYDPVGKILKNGKRLGDAEIGRLDWLGRTVAFCATATVQPGEDGAGYQVSGDPTEAALLVLARKIGISREELEAHYELVEERAFDYQTKLRQVVHKFRGRYLLSVTGAPEAVLDLVRMSEDLQEKTAYAQHRMASDGLRVIAVGHALLAEKPDLNRRHILAFDGLVGMEDSLHDGVRSAVLSLRRTNIKVVMITGDHAKTAQEIARRAGIFHKGDAVLSGHEIERMSPDELAEAVKGTTVFARVTPTHKMHIVQAFRKAGLIVAMTGDGVNDAPSLVAADLGISMGGRGTEVAKEASDIVLLDDSFKGIVAAVEEGRGIYLSIQRVVTYLLSGNSSLVLVIVAAVILLWPVPLLPSQIIWLNFVTDVFLVLALVSEKREEGLLGRHYRHPKSLLTAPIVKRAISMALPMATGTLLLYAQHYQTDPDKARTVAMTALAVFHWANAWNAKSDHTSLFAPGILLSNPLLLVATISAFLLQLVAVYAPFMHPVLHTVPISFTDWLSIILLAGSVIVVEEVRKSGNRARSQAMTTEERAPEVLVPNAAPTP